jgi:hypothetical protein
MRKGEQTRQEIIRKVAPIFNQKGYDGAGATTRRARPDVDFGELATLIAGTLEGSLMMSRLQKNVGPHDLAVYHLEEYLETRVRARKAKAGANKS